MHGQLNQFISDDEFTDFPFTRKPLLPHYISVGKRIGVSGSKESNLSSWIGNEYVTQSSLPIHPLTQILLDNYNSNRLVDQNHKFILGKHNQAILSESRIIESLSIKKIWLVFGIQVIRFIILGMKLEI